MLPAVVVQPVAPAEVNCWVFPSVTEVDKGEIVCAARAVRVTCAFAVPLVPVADTVTDDEDGIVAGARYRPVDEIDPALAVQLVAPAEVNCWVLPTRTDATEGEIVCDAVGADKVTYAEVVPKDPTPEMVTVGDDGMVAGAV